MRGDAPSFDLQSHSRHSDGELGAAEVVATAAGAGVELLALSDHDTVDGIPEAAAAATRMGIRLVPSVEISAIDERHGDLHILGYLIDHRDPVLAERLQDYRNERRRRAESMAQALRELGFALNEGILEQRGRAGESIGRPHLAAAVTSERSNRERLAAEGCEDPSAFLENYLIEGRPAFRARRGPSIRESIETIHDASGLAVWAHPCFDISDLADVLGQVERFRDSGLDGVECFYPTHTRDQAEALSDRCMDLGLLSTGSSDFHGPGHRDFSSFRAFSTYGRSAQLGPIAS